MGMTFDQAYSMLNLETQNAGYWGSGQYQLVHEVMAGLKETYAKPVEMTREDYDNAQECRDRYNFDDDNTRGSSRFSWYFETEEEAMRAWLHPELIKVVE